MSDTASWITFGKDRYHQQHEITAWCREYVGHGGWTADMPASWEAMPASWEARSWAMYGMFGNITYAFKESKHLTAFILRWS